MCDNTIEELNIIKVDLQGSIAKIENVVLDLSQIQPTPQIPQDHLLTDQKIALIEYWNPDSVRVNIRNFALCGFKFRGANYKQGKIVSLDPAVLYPTVSFKNGHIENGYTTNQWYAVFGIKNYTEEYAKLVPIPFLRVKSKTGNTLEFAECGMNGDINTKKNYNFKDLTNHEVLIINENGKWSGLVKKIVNNTIDTITLDNIGNLQVGDFILPAPQLDNYVYLGSFYIDPLTASNRGDDGNGFTSMRAVSISNLNIAGDISAGVDIDFRTFVSPLASGVFFYVYDTYAISNTGAGYINFGTDAAHDVELVRINKTVTGADAFRYYCRIPFCMRQITNIKSSGLANLATARSVHVRGWIE